MSDPIQNQTVEPLSENLLQLILKHFPDISLAELYNAARDLQDTLMDAISDEAEKKPISASEWLRRSFCDRG